MRHALVGILLGMLVAGCTNEDSSPQPPEVQVALAREDMAKTMIEGESPEMVIAGTLLSVGLRERQVFLQLRDPAGIFDLMAAAPVATEDGEFTFSVRPKATLLRGMHYGYLEVRACADADCASPYADGSDSMRYALKVRPPPSVAVTLAQTSARRSVIEGAQISLELPGSFTARGVTADQVFLQVNDSAGAFNLPGEQTRNGNEFSFALRSLATLVAGTYTGTLEVRGCADAGCVKPFEGTPATFTYTLVVAIGNDWEGMQGDANHRGFMPLELDPAKFVKAWEWQRPPSGEPIGGINPVSAGNGKAYVSTDVYFGDATLYALDDSTGAEVWSHPFGQMPALNPPGVKEGRVFVATTGHGDTRLWTFDSESGTLLHSSPFEGQWPHVLAPTVFEDTVYTNGGYYGGYVYAMSVIDGVLRWASGAGDDDMSTPAVDANHVYHYSGTSMEVWDRHSGALVASAPDPFVPSGNWGYSYHGAPMIGSSDNVLAVSGDAFSGRASSNTEHYEQRPISSFDVQTMAWKWTTQNIYLTAPALADGVIYAGRNSPMSFDAINESTGQLMWSWVPSGGTDSEFHRNVVTTRNLVFVSTDRAVYALDPHTRTAVWSYPEPGMLSISNTGMLFIATGARESNGKLVAIRLQ